MKLSINQQNRRVTKAIYLFLHSNFSAHKVLLEYSHARLYIVHGYFHATMTNLSLWQRLYVPQSLNFYHLVYCSKSVLIPVLWGKV